MLQVKAETIKDPKVEMSHIFVACKYTLRTKLGKWKDILWCKGGKALECYLYILGQTFTNLLYFLWKMLKYLKFTNEEEHCVTMNSSNRITHAHTS